MKIYFDCSTLARWAGHPTGISRVMQLLGEGLLAQHEGLVPVVFLREFGFVSYDFRTRTTGRAVTVPSNAIFLTAGANWDIPELLAHLRTLRDSGVAIATLFYDTIPDQFPYMFGPGLPDIYRTWLDVALRMSDIVFAISENTKRDVMTFAAKRGVVCPPVYSVRLGDEIIRREVTPAAPVRPDIAGLGRYILSVGTVEYRKNHIALVNAYRLLVEEGKVDLPTLVIVGRPGWLENSLDFQIRNDPTISHLASIVSDVSDGELDYLYKNALFTVYPALYEGWGLPVAESLRYGKLCVTSGTSSMVEIAPQLTRFAHPLKVEEWARHIDELSSNPEVLNAETERVRSDYRGTTWSDTAEQLLRALGTHFGHS